VGVCGISAKCDVVNHNPICSCPTGYIGDPFSACNRRPGEYHCIQILTAQKFETMKILDFFHIQFI